MVAKSKPKPKKYTALEILREYDLPNRIAVKIDVPSATLAQWVKRGELPFIRGAAGTRLVSIVEARKIKALNRAAGQPKEPSY